MAATSITFTANNVSLMRKNGTQSNHYFPQQVKFRVSKGKFVVQAVDGTVAKLNLKNFVTPVLS